MSHFYFKKKDREEPRGPYTREQIITMVDTHIINQFDMLSKDKESWLLGLEIDGLFNRDTAELEIQQHQDIEEQILSEKLQKALLDQPQQRKGPIKLRLRKKLRKRYSSYRN